MSVMSWISGMIATGAMNAISAMSAMSATSEMIAMSAVSAVSAVSAMVGDYFSDDQHALDGATSISINPPISL